MVLMFCCRPSCLCGPRKRGKSRSHPPLIEHLSLPVMDIRKACSCVGTNGGDGGEETDREGWDRSRHKNRDGFRKRAKTAGNVKRRHARRP